jgi:hypothetical protein
MIKLSTKTFGKKAKKEIKKHIPAAVSFKKVGDFIRIRNSKNETIAHVVEGDYRNFYATLRLV